MKLKNKVAIVTGAGQGIGKGIALELAREGAKVVVSDIDQEHIDETVKEIKKLGVDAIGVKADVSSSAEVEQMVRKVLVQFKTVGILVNNAGIYPFMPFTEMKEEQWDKVMAVNLKGCFNCTKAVAATMIKQKSGKIVNITSIAGGVVGFPNLAHYCASKGGILGFTRGVALDLAPYKINVNAIAPGAIRTPGTAGSEDMMKQIEQMIPLKRIGEPNDIAKAVTFLASDDASYITGQLLVVDGGWTMQ